MPTRPNQIRFRERAELLDFLLEVSAATSETLDLDKLLDPTGGSISTFDAASLQFQFKSVTGVFSFQYVFARVWKGRAGHRGLSLQRATEKPGCPPYGSPINDDRGPSPLHDAWQGTGHSGLAVRRRPG